MCVAPWVKGIGLGSIGVVFTILLFVLVMHRIATSVNNV